MKILKLIKLLEKMPSDAEIMLAIPDSDGMFRYAPIHTVNNRTGYRKEYVVLANLEKIGKLE